ncbi:hypothetical protein [Pseudomonas sp. NPDC096950]|uniref:hypothetical protein n=1 Tax=Pseudomonas sp. NPDC096950 TaxID=3364485 RepID=UPI00383A58B0
MHTCTIAVDHLPGHADENDFETAVCNECVEESAAQDQMNESGILDVQMWDPDLGDRCYFCDKTEEDERLADGE